MNTNIK